MIPPSCSVSIFQENCENDQIKHCFLKFYRNQLIALKKCVVVVFSFPKRFFAQQCPFYGGNSCSPSNAPSTGATPARPAMPLLRGQLLLAQQCPSNASHNKSNSYIYKRGFCPPLKKKGRGFCPPLQNKGVLSPGAFCPPGLLSYIPRYLQLDHQESTCY